MDIEKYVRDIKNKLRKDGYVGKLIDYEELKELHQTYGSNMEEKTFAGEVLGISYSNYMTVKNSGTRAKILKNFLKQLSQEEIEEIQEELKEEGYEGKSIDYEEFKELYAIYGKQMEEKTFAEEVLGISYGCYRAIKNKGTRTKILKKSYSKISKEEIKEIQEKLKGQGDAGKLINYEELKELHQIYGSNMEEKTFAEEVLGISYANHNKLKNKGTRAKILKDVFNKVSKEEIKEIQEKLKEAGYAEKSIDYKEFKEIYEKYGEQMEEKTFAEEVLGISYSNYIAIKNRGTRAKILKDPYSEVSKEEIKEIQEKLKEQGDAGKLINYEELKELHQIYGKEMEEKTFAQQVLGISYGNYGNIKNKGRRARILKDVFNNVSKEEIKEMQIELIKAGYVDILIDYEEFKKIYETYGKQMEEKIFAEGVLGITYSNYHRIRSHQGAKAKILKDVFNKMSKEEIKKMQIELIKAGYVDILIDYKKLKELHHTFGKEMEEMDFALEVLEISKEAYDRIKFNNKSRAKILKNHVKEVSKEEITEIQEILRNEGYIGKVIDNEGFNELYKVYGKNMDEKAFALKVLKMSVNGYYSMMNRNQRARILYTNTKKRLIKEILLKESRYYTKEEIKEICQENDITIDEFVEQFLSNYSKYAEEYKEVIKQGKIWIGKTRLSDDFIKRNYEKMRKLAEQAMVEMKGKYGIDYNKDEEDEIEDSILNVIENRGDIERNFEGKQEMLDMMLYTSIRKFIMFRILGKEKITAKTLSLHKKYEIKQEDGKELQESIASEENIEEKVIQQIEKKQKSKKEDQKDLTKQCIEEMKKQIEKGASREEALNNTSEKLGIGKQEMLEAMQTYLITKGSVRISSGKNVSWSEGEEER